MPGCWCGHEGSRQAGDKAQHLPWWHRRAVLALLGQHRICDTNRPVDAFFVSAKTLHRVSPTIPHCFCNLHWSCSASYSHTAVQTSPRRRAGRETSSTNGCGALGGASLVWGLCQTPETEVRRMADMQEGARRGHVTRTKREALCS